MTRGTFIFIAVLVLVIIAQTAVIIFRKDIFVDTNDREEVLRDSIKVLQTRFDESLVRESKLESIIDSLNSLDAEVIIRNRDKIKFIYSTATPKQLDSIIRSNW